MDSIAVLYKHFKANKADIANVTRKEIIAAGYDGGCNPDLIASDVRRMHSFKINPPKPRRKPAPKRKRKDTGRRTLKQTASTVFHSQLQAAATLELVERVNDNQETEVEDNPLQLVDTNPGEPYSTLLVIHPDDDPDWLTANLPDSGYRMTDYEERQPW